MSEVDADTGAEFTLTPENRGVGVAASIVLFSRYTGRKASDLTENDFEEYTAWVEEHTDDTELRMKAHFKGTFCKLLEYVSEVSEEEITAYKEASGFTKPIQ